MKIMVTGGCGFIGSHFVRLVFEKIPGVAVCNLDKLTYAAHPDTVEELKTQFGNQYSQVTIDIGDPKVKNIIDEFKPDAIVHFAAESHVDRSILDPQSFIQTNITGTQNLLLCAREAKSLRFIHVSTDEVYGSLSPSDPLFTENSPLHPNSPYAASKASSDLIALANARTYNQDVVITRCTNNYGPYQFPEKLLPLVITNALENKSIPVYGDGKQVRDWIYVSDHCEGIFATMLNGKTKEIYNISHQQERFNIDLIESVLSQMQKPKSLMTHVGDRPAHDRRYALSSMKIQTQLGWSPKVSLEEGLKKTVEWYEKNPNWWKKVKGKEFKTFYEKSYKDKFEGVGATL